MAKLQRTFRGIRPCLHLEQQRFCISHELPVCIQCAQEIHSQCNNVVSIDDLKINETWISGLEESFDRAIKKTNSDVANKGIHKFEAEKEAIKRTIFDTKAEIVQHLDNLQDKFFEKELEPKYKQYLNTAKTKCRKLESLKKEMQMLRHDLLLTKNKELNTETCLEILHLKQKFETKLIELHSITSDREIIECQIDLCIQSDVKNFLIKVKTFGDVTVKERVVNYRDKNQFLASSREGVEHGSVLDTRSLNLKFKSKFSVLQPNKKAAITGCTMTPEGRLFIADGAGSGRLFEYTENGKYIGVVNVTATPLDVATIDNNMIAVAFGTREIEVIDISTRKVVNIIKSSGNVRKISDLEGKLCFIDDYEGIVITDTLGTDKKRINRPFVRYATVANDKMIFTDAENHSVHCYDSSGKPILTFHDDFIDQPAGVVADAEQNIFVVGEASNNLTVIQRHGQAFKTLLTAKDGLMKPGAMCFNKKKNILCLGLNDKGEVRLFEVE